MTTPQIELLCSGGYGVHVYRNRAGLWTVSRSHCNSDLPAGHRSHKASSYDLDQAVKDLVESAERRLLVATTRGLEG